MSVRDSKGWDYRVLIVCRASLPMVVGLAFFYLLWATVPISRAFSDEREASVELLVATLLDQSKPGWERRRAFEDVHKLRKEIKEHIFIRVVREADEEMSADAAVLAIRQNLQLDGFLSAIRERFPQMMWRTRSLIVQTVADADSCVNFADIAREALIIAARSGPTVGDERKSAISTVNKGCTALFRSSKSEEDAELVKSSVRVYPEAYMGWLTLHKLNAIDKQLRAIARNVYLNEHYVDRTRMAAAVVVGDTDEEGASIAITIARTYLDEFGRRSIEELFPGGAYAHAERYKRMSDDDILVALLGLLKTHAAEELVLEYVNSDNPIIARISGLVAARRCPRKFLEIAEDNGFEEDFITQRAVVAHFHPELSEQARTGFSQAEFDVALNRVRSGVKDALFGEAGRIVLRWY